jgi:hypothetical protein
MTSPFSRQDRCISSGSPGTSTSIGSTRVPRAAPRRSASASAPSAAAFALGGDELRLRDAVDQAQQRGEQVRVHELLGGLGALRLGVLLRGAALGELGEGRLEGVGEQAQVGDEVRGGQLQGEVLADAVDGAGGAVLVEGEHHGGVRRLVQGVVRRRVAEQGVGAHVGAVLDQQVQHSRAAQLDPAELVHELLESGRGIRGDLLLAHGEAGDLGGVLLMGGGQGGEAVQDRAQGGDRQHLGAVGPGQGGVHRRAHPASLSRAPVQPPGWILLSRESR